MCLYVAIYLSLMGPKGLKEVNEASYAGAHYLHDRLMATNLFSQPFNRPFFNEFCLDLKAGTPQQLIEYCADRGYLAGCKAEGRDKGILFALPNHAVRLKPMNWYVLLNHSRHKGGAHYEQYIL